MTAIKANHQVGLTMNLGATGPWSELMISEQDQLAENAHYCQSWSYWLLQCGRYGVHTFSFQLLAQDFNLGCYGPEVLLPCVGGPHVSHAPKMFRYVQSG